MAKNLYRALFFSEEVSLSSLEFEDSELKEQDSHTLKYFHHVDCNSS